MLRGAESRYSDELLSVCEEVQEIRNRFGDEQLRTLGLRLLIGQMREGRLLRVVVDQVCDEWGYRDVMAVMKACILSEMAVTRGIFLSELRVRQ